MACPAVFDALKARSEFLGPTLYVRASWRDPWLNLVPRGTYEKGTGYDKSVFTIGRSEPTTDEETWIEIAALNADQGACAETYNAVEVGMKENHYSPETFGLKGPVVCQDELTMNWESESFWENYFQALEKRNRKSVINRLGNVYMQYVPKASANADFHYEDGDFTTQNPPAAVDLSMLGGANLPTSDITQDMLDDTAATLNEAGANDPNSNGWITMGEMGAEYPLYIGQQASKRILLNNSELRADYNASYNGLKTANPVIMRMGASKVIGNFRHIINLFPPRWDANLVRVPTWLMSNDAADATKGRVAKINPDWKDPGVAVYEGAIVLNPWVMTEEVLQPVNSAPGMKWTPQNYFGEWNFVTGNDAVLGMDDCAGIQDPLHTRGRHFARYRHALKPIFPEYGRLIVFKRCSSSFDTVECS